MRSFPENASYVTGERLQGLADVTILTGPVRRFHRNLDPGATHLCLFPGDLHDLEVDHPARLRPVADAEVVFVYTHLIEAFFAKIFPRLTRPFVLMSHNSDHGVDGRFAPFLEDPRLFRWYAQNLATDHEKLVSLPLGAANSQWPHGRLDLLHQAASQRSAKTGLVYMNFDARTNPAQRQPVLDALRGHPLVTESAGLDYGAYLRELAAHHFCVCPPGNGLDCHRIWECLYLGVVPLVAADCRLRGFDALPIVYVDDWARLDRDFLENAYRRLARRRLDLATAALEYWRAAVGRARHEVRRLRAAGGADG